MSQPNKAVYYTPHDRPGTIESVLVCGRVDDNWVKVQLGGEIFTVHDTELSDSLPSEQPNCDLAVSEDLLLLDIPRLAGIQLTRTGFIRMNVEDGPRVFDIRNVYELSIAHDVEHEDSYRVTMCTPGFTGWIVSTNLSEVAALHTILNQARDYFTGFSKTLHIPE